MRPLLPVSLLLCVSCASADGLREREVSDIDAQAIYLNQHGLSPVGPKIAIVHGASDEPYIWELRNSEGEIIAQDQTVPLGFSERAGQPLHRIDFSDVSETGSDFKLAVGETESHPFDIQTGLYSDVAEDALSYFYHNRAGEPVLAEHVGEAYARPAGHPNEVVTCFEGADLWGTDWPGCDYELDVTGGWYDAGDHGKYIVNAGISTWTLLDAYEQFGDQFADGTQAIPEAGNGVNDLLDEARDNIEWMLSMQVPDGESAWVAVGEVEVGKPLNIVEIEDAGGLVHHKVHDERWAGSEFPHENTLTRYLYPPSTGATLNLAAIGAKCARIWADINPAFSQRCSEASTRAIAADNRTRGDVFTATYNFNGGGPYGFGGVDDETVWVQIEELASHQDNPRLMNRGDDVDLTVPGYPNTAMLGTITAAQHLESESHTQSVIELADSLLAEIPDEPLHIPYASDAYGWGSNGSLSNRGMVLGHAYLLTGERKYRDGVVHIMDYLMGRNPMNISYVSGYGEDAFENPHHRHWSHSQRDDAPKPPPGVLSGGPNSTNMSDPVAETLKGQCAPQTCYIDDHGAWTLNEVTINWNAPFFWISAFLDATEKDLE